YRTDKGHIQAFVHWLETKDPRLRGPALRNLGPDDDPPLLSRPVLSRLCKRVGLSYQTAGTAKPQRLDPLLPQLITLYQFNVHCWRRICCRTVHESLFALVFGARQTGAPIGTKNVAVMGHVRGPAASTITLMNGEG